MNCPKCNNEMVHLKHSNEYLCGCGERVIGEEQPKGILSLFKEVVSGILKRILYYERRYELLELEKKVRAEREKNEELLKEFKTTKETMIQEGREAFDIYPKKMEEYAEKIKQLPALEEAKHKIDELSTNLINERREKALLNRKIEFLTRENTRLLGSIEILRGVEIVKQVKDAYIASPISIQEKEEAPPLAENTIERLEEEFAERYARTEEDNSIFSTLLAIVSETTQNIALNSKVEQRKVKSFIENFENKELELPTLNLMLKKIVVDGTEHYKFFEKAEYQIKKEVLGIEKSE